MFNADKARAERLRFAQDRLKRGPRKAYKGAQLARLITRHQKRLEQAKKRLGGVCKVCGTTKGLEYDHIDWELKLFAITSSLAAADHLFWVEVDKCQLLCKEHHKEKTRKDKANMWRGPIILPTSTE